MRFAEVAVDAPAGHDRTFSYSIPRSFEVQPGQLVVVPFGPRTLQGVVFSLAPSPQVENTRDILRADDPGPLLTDTQLALARWVSRYYMSTLFEAAALMLPPGRRMRLKTYLAPSPSSNAPQDLSLTPYQAKVLEYIRGKTRVSEDRLVETMGEAARAAASALVRRNLVDRTQARSAARVGPKYSDYVGLSEPITPELADRFASVTRRAPRQRALLERLLEGTAPVLLRQARKDYGPSAVNALIARGWLRRERVAVDRDPLDGLSVPLASQVTLTPAQETAAAEVRSALSGHASSQRTFLLQGVTGSGKTEVYVDAVRRCIQLGKKAIALVPEIALTHQIVEHFAAMFPGNVAVLHSGLTSGERFDQWWKIRQGEYDVVIGSRSAVFAPLPDLGLIVMDEEHEWTYKQHELSPRYHARDVALRIAELRGAVVVLGSASPDVKTYQTAAGGGFRLLRLPDRVVERNGPGQARTTTSALASSEIVDMRKELRESGLHVFSRALLGAMDDCLKAGSQAILFLNRRGSASYMQCRGCGHALRCRRCDVSLTYHRAAARLICHRCGDKRRVPEKCPQCLGHRLRFFGIGTQAVVDEIAARFPGATVLRWDSDSAGTAAAHASLLKRFRAGEAQFLVGTQMIAKGLHFPSVTLVGVVLADVGLNLPDYRACERSFQLLCQVAGRAGRGPAEGRVILQTYQPENYAIKAAARQDYQSFYHQELAHRREQGNPPFSNLIRLLYVHTSGALCEREALRFSELLRGERDSWGFSDADILGPMPAFPARSRGRHRWQIVLRGPSPRLLLDKVSVPHGWVVDIDPVGFG